MKLALLAPIFACAIAVAQQIPVSPVDVASEPHHILVLENEEVRVFRLKLEPKQVTAPHRHSHFFAFVSLAPVKIANEVRGRQPVVTDVEAGEVHTAKGRFTVAERNLSPHPAEVIIVEAMKSGPDGAFATAMGGFKLHSAAIGELFEAPHCRAYTLTIASEGQIEKRKEQFDRVVVAVSDLKLREEVDGQAPSELLMKAGEIRWFPHGMVHATTNVGDLPGTFITFELN